MICVITVVKMCASWVRNKFWPLWWRVSLSIRLYTTQNHTRFVFYHNIKETNSLSWQLKTPTEIWKCTSCIMQITACTRQTFLSKTFANSLISICRDNSKKCLGKSNDAYSLSVRVYTTKNHISICFFYHTISTSKKMFFLRGRAEKGIAWYIDASNVAWTLIYHGK